LELLEKRKVGSVTRQHLSPPGNDADIGTRGLDETVAHLTERQTRMESILSEQRGTIRKLESVSKKLVGRLSLLGSAR
jgi:hypothetical protein